jgi:ABC-2 type transport system permease protein
MNQFLSVLRFEIRGYLKNKVYMGMTVALVLVVAIVLSFPALKGMFTQSAGSDAGGGGPAVQAPVQSGPALAVINENNALSEDALKQFTSFLYGFTAQVVTTDVQAVKEQVTAGTYEGAVVITSDKELTYIARNLGMYDNTGAMLSGALQSAFRTERLLAIGAAAAEIPQILTPPVSVSVENLGVSQMDTFFYTYALIFALYMAILIYGQLVATAVATEKSTRTMELLITSARPNSLLFGKVIGSGLAGLIQMIAIFGSAILFYNINEASWAGNQIIASIFNMPLNIVGFALLFFVLGYFLYAFLFGAIGSLASRTEDVNTSVLPVMFGFIIAFMVVITSMASGNIDNAAMKFCSYLPFTSPMAMFVRIAMASPAWYEIVLSVILLIVSTELIGVLSARIYRIGVLMYGKPPKLGELIRVLRAARKARA